MKPSIGRIVHYVSPDHVHFPAIVTIVHQESRVDLNVFNRGIPSWISNCAHSDDHRPGTWHWPERDE